MSIAVALTLVHPAGSTDTVVSVAALDEEVRDFLHRELDSHLGAIASLDTPPERVHGALTTGEFSWGTFMRSLAAYAQLADVTTLANRDLARTIGEIGLIEVKLGGTRFSQLYAALSLRHYGVDLSRNRLWQALTPSERDAWRTLLDATRFYDPVNKQVIDLPENYLGVAARIATIAWEVKLLQDRALLDSLLDRAAVQFMSGALYADDALPTGRYDRYSNEYARYVWEAAQIAGRTDLLDAIRPSLTTQMRLWWDLLACDGYGYAWGRSLGVVSYLDTLEIAGFLALNPEFRPAPLEQLAAAYNIAWRWLRKDYKDDRHMLSVFDFGRGNFAYISRNREWQQTVGFLGKLAHAHGQLTSGLGQGSVDRFPAQPLLPAVARFEFFKKSGRQAGVWLVRSPTTLRHAQGRPEPRRGTTGSGRSPSTSSGQSRMHFALPFTTGTRPGVADYLPAPHGLPGFAVPVEQVVPALAPFLELENGDVMVATDGADSIVPSADGGSVKATWTRWARIGAKPTELVDPDITAAVEWRIDGQSLSRGEQLTVPRQTRIRRWRMIVPATGDRVETTVASGVRSDTFSGREGRLTVTLVKSDWPYRVSARATGDTPDGRGARGHIPVHLAFEAEDIVLQPGTPRGWTLRLEVD